MSLLDELKRDATTALSQQPPHESDRTQKLQSSHAALHRALQYWLEFFKALNVLKPMVARNYYLEGSTQLKNLIQCDYNVNSRRITVEHRDYLDSLELRFRCASDENIVIEKDSPVLVSRLQEHLWQHGLRFDLREVRREGRFLERGIFTIPGEVTVRFTIAADADREKITVTVRNLERLGEYSYVYGVDELDLALFEEMGKAMLAQPNKLRRMGRYQAAAVPPRTGVPARRATDQGETPS